MSDVSIAVIGAGIAGLACASELSRADAKVTVFERSRGLGGRLATRRQGNFAFDHGAQFVTARSRPFVQYVEVARRAPALLAAGSRASSRTTASWDAPIDDWQVGTPGMSAFVRPLHAQRRPADRRLRARAACRASAAGNCRPTPAARTRSSTRSPWPCPPRRRSTLLGPHGRAFRHLADVRMAPCWAAMYGVRHADRRRRRGASLDRRARSPGPPATRASRGRPRHRSAGSCTRRRHGRASTSRPTRGEAARLLLHEFATAVGLALPHAGVPAGASLAPRARRAAARPAVPRRRGDRRGRVRRLVHRTARRGRLRERPHAGSLAAVDGRTVGAGRSALTLGPARRAARPGAASASAHRRRATSS